MPVITQPIWRSGPMIEIIVGPSAPREAALRAAGLPIPSPVLLIALIDTGASGSAIDSDVIDQLGLTPTGQISIHTPSTGGSPSSCELYDVSLTLTHRQQASFSFHAVPVISVNLKAQGIQALLGRNILKNCLFVYNGIGDSFSIAF